MTASRYAPGRPGDVADFVRDQMLGLMVSGGPGDHAVTPLPLLPTVDAAGEVTEFFGHFARSNPQIATLQAEPRALILYQGPHAYIPPAWVSKPQWAPTWNYALAQFEVEVRFLPEENHRSILDLVAALEGGAWTVEQMGERFERMLPHILAFRARVTRQTTKFKLGQDETPQSFDEILEHLGDAPVAAMMRRARI